MRAVSLLVLVPHRRRRNCGADPASAGYPPSGPAGGNGRRVSISGALGREHRPLCWNPAWAGQVYPGRGCSRCWQIDARVFVRPVGLGWSEPRTYHAMDETRHERCTSARAAERGPFVLVGHSLGGSYGTALSRSVPR